MSTLTSKTSAKVQTPGSPVSHPASKPPPASRAGRSTEEEEQPAEEEEQLTEVDGIMEVSFFVVYLRSFD